MLASATIINKFYYNLIYHHGAWSPWSWVLGCQLCGVWSGGGGHLLHHLLLLHEHVLDLLHLSVQLIEVDLFSGLLTLAGNHGAGHLVQHF